VDLANNKLKVGYSLLCHSTFTEALQQVIKFFALIFNFVDSLLSVKLINWGFTPIKIRTGQAQKTSWDKINILILMPINTKCLIIVEQVSSLPNMIERIKYKKVKSLTLSYMTPYNWIKRDLVPSSDKILRRPLYDMGLKLMLRRQLSSKVYLIQVTRRPFCLHLKKWHVVCI